MNKPLATAATRRRVQAIGAYGFGNFGDELFVATVLENAQALWPHAKVRTFTSGSRAYSSTGLFGRCLRLGTAVAGFVWADTIAMCGGSILQDVRGNALLRQPFLKYRQTDALGVSVGPFPTKAASERVRQTLKHVDRLIVRDRASVERMRELNSDTPVSLGGDLVALSMRVQPRAIVRRETITICPSAAAPVPESTLRQNVLEALASFRMETGTTPKVRLLALSQNPNSNDLPLCEMLFAALSAEGFTVSLDTFEELGLDGTCDAVAESLMVWSYRLHGAIVSYLAGVPFLIVGHHAKCVDFGDDIGAHESTVLTLDQSWTAAVIALANGAAPHMPPAAYRTRAHAEYLRDTAHTDPRDSVARRIE